VMGYEIILRLKSTTLMFAKSVTVLKKLRNFYGL